MQLKSICLISSSLIISSYFFLWTNVNANELVSKDKTLSITFNDATLRTSRCNPNTKIGSYAKIGSYTKVDGSAGNLYIDCRNSERGVITNIYKFVDNVGLNRCTGKMEINFVGGREISSWHLISSWYFDGKVKGYNCPKARAPQKIERFNMDVAK